MALETPTEGAAIEPQQVLRGFAIDLRASGSTGIDAIVISLDGALESPDNRLIGVADYGAPRLDLVEALGDERFTEAGFQLNWDSVGAGGGPRRLFVQAHSACGWHTISQTVRLAGPPVSGSGVVNTGALLPTTGGTTSTASQPGRGTGPQASASGLAVTPTLFTPAPTSVAVRAPDNVRLLSVGATSVTLGWDAPAGESPASYLIYQSTVAADGSNTAGVNVARVPGTATSVTVEGLTDPGRYTYFFTVSSLSANGIASPYANSFVMTTPPLTRVPVAAGASSPSAPPGAAQTPGPTPLLPGAPGAQPTAPLQVSAVPCIAPQGTNFISVACANGPSGAVITWITQSDAVSYNVYGALLAAVNPPPGWTPAGQSPLSGAVPGTWVALLNGVRGTNATIANLVPGGSYAFVVRGVNQAGQESSQSTAPQLTLDINAPMARVAPTSAALPPLAGTSALTPTGPLTPGLPLTPTGALTPGLLTPGVLTPGLLTPGLVPTPGGNPTPLLALSPTPPAGAIPSPGALLGGPQLGTPTPAGPPQPLQAVTPGQPLQLQAQATASATVVLNWSPVVGASVTYAVLVQRGNRPQVPDPQRGSLNTSTVTIDSVPPNEQFTFQVVARDGQGAEISRSNPAAVVVPPPGPPGGGPYPTAPVPSPTIYAPTPVAAVSLPGSATAPTLRSNPSVAGSANLQWDMVANASSYSVWMVRPGGQWENVIPTTANPAAFIPSLTAGSYTFQVRARDASGAEFVASNVIQVQVN